MATTRRHDVKDLALAGEGIRRIEWADRKMPVLRRSASASRRSSRSTGYRIAACLHVTTETANLRAHAQGGRRRRGALRLEPALDAGRRRRRARRGVRVSVFAIKGEDNDTYYQHIEAALDHKPHITMDDGADVVGVLHAAPARPARRHHRRHRGDDDRRHSPRRWSADGALKLPDRRASTRRTPSTSSTTATGPASRPSTASCAPTNMLLAGSTLRRRAATAGAAAASRCAPGAWART